MLNNPLKESIKENDQCELFLYEEQEENKPSITSLATTTSLELQEQEETLKSKANNLHYCFANTEEFNSFNSNSQLFIQREQGGLKETLMALNNYRFYLEEQEINKNPNTNDSNSNNNTTNKESNSPNINQDSMTTQANLESQDSTPPLILYKQSYKKTKLIQH